eukprot:XP_001697142.1 predicted protein [Chlamydomonas reinhardtii]
MRARHEAVVEGLPPQLRPVFIPADSFLRIHALHHANSATRATTVQPEELQPCEEYDGLRVALKFSRALTRAVMEGCTRRLLAALGEAVRSGRQVAVDMGVGTLTGRDRALGFEFMPSYLAAHRTLAGSTRLGAWAGAAAQVPQTRREQVLTGLAQLQAELAAGDDGSEEDSGGGVGGRDQALPGAQITGGTMASGGPSRPTSPGPTRAQPSMSAARAQALAVLRGRNASPRRAEAAPHNATGLAAAGVMGAQSQPQKQLVAQLWSPDNSLKGAVGRQETGAAAPGQRRNTATGTPVGKDAAADNAPWLRPRSQAPQQGAAEPAAARAVVADSGRQNPTQRVSYDGGKAGTSGDLDMEDQQAPRSARKPLFSSPPAGKFPVRAAQGDAKSLRRLELPHARTEKCTGVEADSARADDRTLSRSGQERLRDQSGALDRSRSPSPGPRPGAHGVVVTYAAVRSASPGPNLRYGDASTTADVTGVPAAAFARPLGSASERAAYEVAGGQAALERLVGGSKAAAEDRPLCLAKAAAAGPTSPPRRHVYALQQQQQAQQPSQSCRTQPSGPNAAATVGMAASVGSIDSLQRPASVLGRRAGGDPCVVESWEAELEAEFEDVEDLLEGVEQCLGFSADLPDTFEQDADEHTTRHGWEEPAGARHPCQAGGHSSAGGCAEEWSSSGMACSSSATSCFSFGRGGVGQVSNSSSLRGAIYGLAAMLFAKLM